jgi:hypothetical protein
MKGLTYPVSGAGDWAKEHRVTGSPEKINGMNKENRGFIFGVKISFFRYLVKFRFSPFG